MSVRQETLLLGDAHLSDYIAHTVGVLKQRLAPDLARNLGECLDFFGEGAGGNSEYRAHLVPGAFAYHLGGKAQKAQVGANVAIELIGRVLRGWESAHQVCHDRHIGQLVKGQMAQVKVCERIGEAACGDGVLEAGERRGLVDGERRLGAGGADVRDVQARQGGAGLGRVFGLLGCTQGLDIGVDSGELLVACLLESGCKLGSLGVVAVGRLLGLELYECTVVRVKNELAQEVLKVVARKLLTKLLIDGAILECKGCGGVVVEPGGKGVAGDYHAIGRAVVALTQVELVATDYGFQTVAGDAGIHQLAGALLNHLA